MNAHTVIGHGGTKLHVQEAGKRAGKPILFIHGFSQCSLAVEQAVELGPCGLVSARGDGSPRSRPIRQAARCVRGLENLGRRPSCRHRATRAHEAGAGRVVLWRTDHLRLRGPLRRRGHRRNELGCGRMSSGRAAGRSLVPRSAIPRGRAGLLLGADESVGALRTLIRLCIPSGLSPEEEYLLLGTNVAVPVHVRVGLFSRNLDNDSVVASMRKPLLVSWCEADAIALPTMRDHLARLAPHAKISTYPGAGHAPFWEAPERFNRELRVLREAA